MLALTPKKRSATRDGRRATAGLSAGTTRASPHLHLAHLPSFHRGRDEHSGSEEKVQRRPLLPLSSAHCIGAGERLSAAVPSSASAVVLRGAGVVQGQRRRSRSDAAAQPGVHEPRTCAVGVRGGHTWKAVAAGQSVKLSAVTVVPERPAVLHGNARVPSNDRECAKCKVVTEPVSCDLAQDDRWCNGHGGRGNFGQGQRSTLRSLIPRSP